MIERHLWDGGTIPAMGLGCWAIGGTWTAGTTQAGWGTVDDAVSARAIHTAVDLGIRLFDTAQAYGAGHSETVLGRALAGHPDVRIATKVGYAVDPASRTLTGEDASPAAIVLSIDHSLRRLRRDRIDLVHLHLNELSVDRAEPVFDALEALRVGGKIDAYGWSTDFPDRAAAFADRTGFVSVQHTMNVFFRADALLPVIEAKGLMSINRSPLAMGLLGGKYGAGRRLGADDVRGQSLDWMVYFKGGEAAPDYLRQLDAVRALLQTDGRSLVQGALGWLWGRSANSFPIPGFHNGAQVTELAGALEYGPLSADVMAAIEAAIIREPEGAVRPR